MTNIIKRDRKLGEGDDVYSQNAWDDTEWTDEMIKAAESRIQEQKQEAEEFLKQPERVPNIENGVTSKWDEFYAMHEDRFFKDRRWLFSEFPELLEHLREDSGPSSIFEVGCGVGNAVAHILKTNKNPNLHIYCCDLSQNAINTLKIRDWFDETQIEAFQADICTAFDKVPIEPGSIDFITLIFALSAMKPDLMGETINSLSKLLKTNGMFLVRDYARLDMTQLRFRGKSLLAENYYVRSDGTTSYFLTRDSLDKAFMGSNHLERVDLKNDNRLLINRLKSLKMCRCWLQAKYRKLET